MDKGIAFFFCQFQCIGTGLIIDISIENHFCTVALGAVYFDQRCGRRHNDHCLCTKLFCCIGNALCMVSCGGCDQTFLSLFFAQCADFIVSTSYFISTGCLHIFRFQINFVSCLLTEIFTVDQLCLLCCFFYDF